MNTIVWFVPGDGSGRVPGEWIVLIIRTTQLDHRWVGISVCIVLVILVVYMHVCVLDVEI